MAKLTITKTEAERIAMDAVSSALAADLPVGSRARA